uniref:Uncharacterized protein n=1 Tax=Neogobius melanostomus TaxID=47308 RepID=A0A8C6UAS7_9GOBI
MQANCYHRNVLALHYRNLSLAQGGRSKGKTNNNKKCFSSTGPSLRMVFHTISLFSFLFLLLLPRPLLFYSLKNCTTDAHDNSIVFCDNRELEIIPPDIPRTATYLDLSENQLTKISQNDLTGFIRLQTLSVRINVISQIEVGLNLARNKLRNLSDNMFDGLSHLSILDLSRNKIKSISKFAFYNLDNLQELNLWNNNLVDMSNIINILQNCPLLMILDLGENNLTALVSDDFPFPSLNLTTLDIGENGLRKVSVQSNIFNKLESLVLSANDPDLVWEVSDKALFNSLKSLHLEMNGFEFETYQLIFESVSSVETLYLRGTDSDLFNYATSLCITSYGIHRIRQTDLCGFTRLKDLDLGHNNISNIEDGAFSDLSALTSLTMSFNQLTNLTQHMFKGLFNVSRLDLSQNKIGSISKFAFEPLNELCTLILSNNHLVQSSDIANIVSHCPLLENLYLDNNKLTSLQSYGLSLPLLKVLHLAGNNLSLFEAENLPFVLLNLTKLDLRSNPLRKISVHSDVFPRLQSLELSFMSESVIEWDVPDKVFFQSLIILDLDLPI